MPTSAPWASLPAHSMKLSATAWAMACGSRSARRAVEVHLGIAKIAALAVSISRHEPVVGHVLLDARAIHR